MSSSVSFAFSSLFQMGWQKSPVPNKSIPFSFAYFSRFSRSRFFEVALECLEWRWRSAIIDIVVVVWRSI